jgi:predicted AAA+ superfamily ATPase
VVEIFDAVRYQTRSRQARPTWVACNRIVHVLEKFDLSRRRRLRMTPTISNNLSVLEAIYVAHIVRPFSTRKAVEIVAAPKVYGFDSFVCYFRGWQQPRPDDLDLLWEHYVLNELHAHLQIRRANH